MKNLKRVQIDEFNNEVVEILEFYGLQKVSYNESYHRECYEINSDKIGKLSVMLDTDIAPCYTIYAKFQSTEKAINYFNVRPYNGKMNIHTYNENEALLFIDELLHNYNIINGIDKHAEHLAV